ncbi:MAG: hypothetical protein ABIT01_20200 [Thermoanaerobaculia bacterium]
MTNPRSRRISKIIFDHEPIMRTDTGTIRQELIKETSSGRPSERNVRLDTPVVNRVTPDRYEREAWLEPQDTFAKVWMELRPGKRGPYRITRLQRKALRTAFASLFALDVEA